MAALSPVDSLTEDEGATPSKETPKKQKTKGGLASPPPKAAAAKTVAKPKEAKLKEAKPKEAKPKEAKSKEDAKEGAEPGSSADKRPKAGAKPKGQAKAKGKAVSKAKASPAKRKSPEHEEAEADAESEPSGGKGKKKVKNLKRPAAASGAAKKRPSAGGTHASFLRAHVGYYKRDAVFGIKYKNQEVKNRPGVPHARHKEIAEHARNAFTNGKTLDEVQTMVEAMMDQAERTSNMPPFATSGNISSSKNKDDDGDVAEDGADMGGGGDDGDEAEDAVPAMMEKEEQETGEEEVPEVDADIE